MAQNGSRTLERPLPIQRSLSPALRSHLVGRVLKEEGLKPSTIQRLSQEAQKRDQTLAGFLAWWIEETVFLATLAEGLAAERQ